MASAYSKILLISLLATNTLIASANNDYKTGEINLYDPSGARAAGVHVRVPPARQVSAILRRIGILNSGLPDRPLDPPLLYLRAGTMPLPELRLEYPGIPAVKLIDLRRAVLDKMIGETGESP